MVDVNLAVGVPEKDVVRKQDGTCYKRDIGVPEEEVIRKQDGAGCNETWECLRKISL